MQRRQNEAAGGFDAADDFDHDVHCGIGNDLGDVVRNAVFFDAEFERALPVQLKHAFDNDVDALRTAIEIPVIAQNFIGPAPDDPQPEDRDAHRFHFLPSAFKSYKYFSPCSVSSLSTTLMQEISLAMISLNPPVATTGISGRFISRRIFFTM